MARTIKLEHITKIEGHANLTLKIENGKVVKCELGSIEGSRYFEGMLRGRNILDAPEITTRICGICSTIHALVSIQAVEKALGVKPTKQTKQLRDLQCLGERIRSHATHLYFLALPDYLGFESALQMTKKYKKELELALGMVKVGNDIVRTIGGRDMHTVSAQPGGYLKIPTQEQIDELCLRLKGIKEDAIKTAKLIASLKIPHFARNTEYFSVTNPEEYGMLIGDVKSQTRIFKETQYHHYINEYHEEYSTANFVVKEGKSYMVGSLARVNNNRAQLSLDARKIIKESGIEFPNSSPFVNNFAQAIELVDAVDRAVKICKELKVKPESRLVPKMKAGHGYAAGEAPRGTLWHEYRCNEHGTIEYANIVTPTAQNLRNMQEDVHAYVQTIATKPKEYIVNQVEKLIRSYDPCFSCSTHFLKVKWE